MTAIPAKVAGVPEVVLSVAAGPTARSPPGTLAAAALAGVDEVYAVGGARGHRRAGLRHRVDPRRSTSSSGPGNVYVAAGQARGRRPGWSACRRRSPARPRSWSSPTRRPPPAFAAVDVMLQAEHGPDGLAWLITWDEAVADARRGRGRPARAALAPPRATSRPPSPRAATPCCATGPSRRWRSPTPSPPSTSSCSSTTPRRCCRWSATPARCSAGRASPASVGDYLAGPSHVLPTYGSARFSGALTRGRLPEARPRRHPRPRRPGRGRRRTSRRSPRSRGSTPTPTRSGIRRGRRDRARATTSRSWRATTRPRSTSTSGSTPTRRPSRRPPGSLDALAAELADVDWHRYPDRVATRRCARRIAAHHGVDPAQVFAANGSNEVLQTLCLTYGGPGRTVAVFEPTYALHSHIARITGTGVAVGERTDDFALDLDEVRRVLAEADAGDHVPVLAQQPHRHGRDRGDRPRGARPRARAARGRRGLRPVRAVVGARAGRRRRARSWSPARTPRRGRWRRPASATSSARAELVAELDKVVLPYHLDAVKQVAGRARARLRRRDASPGRRAGRGAGPARRPALADLPVDVWPSGANFVLFRPRDARRRRGVAAACSTARSSCATARRGLASTAASVSPSAPPPRTTRFLAALEEVLA